MLALDGRAVSARTAMTEWVVAKHRAAIHSGRRAATSPIKGEEKACAGVAAFGAERAGDVEGA
jgi:hypothetical protein